MRSSLAALLIVASVVAVAGEGLALKFKWRAGQELKYQVQVEGRILKDGALLQDLAYSGLWIRKITGVDSEGAAFFEATSRNVRRSDGFWVYDFGGYTPGFTTKGKVKFNGQVALADHAREGDPEYWSLLIFPEQPVPLGGVWKYRPPAEVLAQELGVQAEGEVIYQAKTRLRYKSRNCLQISRESHYRVGYDPRNEFREIVIETRGTLYFDELVGNLVDAEVTEVYTAKLLQGEKAHEISGKAKITFAQVR